MEVFKTLNGIKTRLLVWSNPFSTKADNVIVFITGNPGIVDFYYEFGSDVHRTVGMPLCIVGQGGHDIIADEKPYSLKDERYLFGLQSQVAHKLDLLNNVINKHSKLNLIGYSMGAWMIIELMQKNPSISERVASVNLLFPTLQNIVSTKNGSIINIVRQIHIIVQLFIKLLHLLPKPILKKMAGFYVHYRSLPSHFTNRFLKLINASILQRVLYLAYDGVENVKVLNIVSIENVKHKTTVIYGEDDGWVPQKYIDDLKQFKPYLKMVKVPYRHEFAFESSEEVAELVSDSIKSRRRSVFSNVPT